MSFTRKDRRLFYEALNGLSVLYNPRNRHILGYLLENTGDEDKGLYEAARRAGIDLNNLSQKGYSLLDVVSLVKGREEKLFAMGDEIDTYDSAENDFNTAIIDRNSNFAKAQSIKKAARIFYEDMHSGRYTKDDKKHLQEFMYSYRSIYKTYMRIVAECSGKIDSIGPVLKENRYLLTIIYSRLNAMNLDGLESNSFIQYANLLVGYADSQGEFLQVLVDTINRRIDSHRVRLTNDANYSDDYRNGENSYLSLLRVMAVDGIHITMPISSTEVYDNNASIDYTLLPDRSRFIKRCVENTLRVKGEVTPLDYQRALGILEAKSYDIIELTYSTNTTNKEKVFENK